MDSLLADFYKSFRGCTVSFVLFILTAPVALAAIAIDGDTDIVYQHSL